MKYIIVRVEYSTEGGIQMTEKDKGRPLYETEKLEELRTQLHEKIPCRNINFHYYEN